MSCQPSENPEKPQLILVAGDDFFAEERRDTIHRIHPYKPGVPAFVVENSAKNGRFRITKTVFTDPDADVLVEHVKFLPSGKQSGRMSIYSLMAPHIGNMGNGNTAWIGDYKGVACVWCPSSPRQRSRLLPQGTGDP